MPLAYISQLGTDIWRLSFYEHKQGRVRLTSSVTCCWDSALIILEIRERNEEAGRTARSPRDRGGGRVGR